MYNCQKKDEDKRILEVILCLIDEAVGMTRITRGFVFEIAITRTTDCFESIVKDQK